MIVNLTGNRVISASDKQVGMSLGIEPVLLIHGTFANKRNDRDIAWWLQDSKFCSRVDEFLKIEGAAARCWAERTPFAWTGENSEVARRNGGRALAEEIVALEADNRVTQYHLVGHSHGGNVILNALRALRADPRKLGAVVFMGTPVLSFRHREAPDAGWIAIPLYVAALAAGIWAYPDSWGPIWATGLAWIFLALLTELWRLSSRGRRLPDDPYGSGHPSAFVFEEDEARRSLKCAQNIANNPRDFIGQFIEPVRPDPSLAIKPTAPPKQQILRTRLRETGPYLLAQWLRGPPPTIYLPTRTEPFVLNAALAQTIWDTMRSIMEDMGIRAVATTVLWVCAILPSFLLATLMTLYTLALRAAGMLVGKISLWAAKILGRFALPRLVRKAVFGQDQGKFQDVKDLPPAVSKLETMSSELCARAKAISEQLGQDVGQAIKLTVNKGNVFAIKAYVTNALSNTALAHSYYYQDEEIMKRVAQLIATSRATPRAPSPLTLWERVFNTNSNTAASQVRGAFI